MKKFLVFCIAALFCGNAMAQSSITGATVKIAPNGTADLELNIEGVELAAIAQVTLQFPDKISIEKNQKGRYKYTLGDLCSDGHSATVKDKNDGSVLVLVQNNDGDPFEDNSGLLITLPLKAADDITAGEYNILMSGIVIGTNDSPSRKLNSVTEGTIKVVVKNQAVISVSESSILGTFGVNLTAPTATVSQGYDGTLSYKSSNEQVVNVSQNGSLTIVGVGSAVITISGSETSTWFAPADVSYSVQIDKASITPVVTLVGWTFGQTANVPSVTGNTGNGSVTYQYKVKGAADETYSTTVPTDAGNYTVKVIVEATANYKAGTATADFTIAPKDVNASMIQAIADLIYTGSALTPQITVKDGNTAMTLNSDYTVAYSNNTNAGTATVTISGKGNYQGTASKTFTIQKASITPGVTLQGWTYGEAAKTPAVTGNTGNGAVTYQYKGKDAADATYTSTVPTDAGEYTVKAVVAETNNYKSGTATANFTISAKALNKNMVDDIEEQIYTGFSIEPKPDVLDGNKKLEEGTDYTIQYSNNTQPTNLLTQNTVYATITITGKGNYQGTVEIQFVIRKIGDVNSDTEVNALDIQDTITLMCDDAYDKKADVNNDNVVDALDIMDTITIICEQ